MTRAQSKIPFHNLKFHDELPKPRDIETRLATFLKTTRETAQRVEIEAGRVIDEDRVYPCDLVDDADRRKIKIRAMRYLERLHSSTGMYHVAEENRVRLIPLKGGLPVAHIATEHEADEIAAALHDEMPWMAPATEAVCTGCVHPHGKDCQGCGSIRWFWLAPLGSAKAIGPAAWRIISLSQ